LPPVAPWQARQNSASAPGQRGAHELGGRRVAQRPQRQAGAIVGELLPERAGRLRIGHAAGSDEHDRQAVEAPRQVAEEAQRRRVGPVGVVDGEHQGTAVGEVDGQPVEPVERSEGGVAPLRLERRAHLAEQPLGEPRRAREQRFGLGVDRRLEQLAGDAERERVLQRRTAGLEHAQAGGRGVAPRPRQQARLAHAGRTVQDHEPAAAAARALDRAAQPAKLVLALEQAGSCRDAHRAAALRRERR
jgi:hypothetical protein